MTKQKNMNEAVRYFRHEPGFYRLFSLFQKKYESIGRIGGTVKLTKFTDEGLEAVAAFFGQTPSEMMEKGTISLKKFEQQLQRTRFEGLDLKELLEGYFNKRLRSNHERKEQKVEAEQAFINDLKATYSDIGWWFDHILLRQADTRFIYKMYETNRFELRGMIKAVARAIRGLPSSGQAERLPIFAQRITSDPHAFDPSTNQGKLLLHALSVKKAYEENGLVQIPGTSEDINECLQNAGLLRDDLLNFVTCAGLLAETEDGLHPVWQEAVRMDTVWNVPVRELLSLRRIFPANGSKVWVVENSSVCSAILDQCPDAPIICTHGQFKLAAWLLLDLLVKEDCYIHYSGDFDPEGLGIAQRLRDRYPQQVVFWRMDLESYHQSQPDKFITKDRLEKLKQINRPNLVPVARELERNKRAGYQEALLKHMVEDIKNS